MTIGYLKTKYLTIVNGCCKCYDFKWMVKVPKERCLWLRLHEEIRRLFKSTLSFMKKKYEVMEMPIVAELSYAMTRFENKFESKQKRLKNLFNLNESVADSLQCLG